MATITNI